MLAANRTAWFRGTGPVKHVYRCYDIRDSGGLRSGKIGNKASVGVDNIGDQYAQYGKEVVGQHDVYSG